MPIINDLDSGVRFSDHYKDELFLFWYADGKPSSPRFAKTIPPDTAGNKPSPATLGHWMTERSAWRKRSETLDEEVKNQIEAYAIAKKVEMLTRHSDVGRELQEVGAEYIRENLDKLKPSTAVRMIVEGVRIEQNSRGIGTAFKEMIDMPDAELAAKIEDLLDRTKVEISQIEDGNQ